MARSTKAAQALTTGEVTGCISYNLREVLNHYSGDDQRDKKWGFPFWQRDYAWTRDQEDGWERRILKGGTITGVLQIFRIKRDPDELEMVNDGGNRIRCTARLVERWRRQGVSTLEINGRLDRSKIYVQHIEYHSLVDAMEEFGDTNDGTGLSPYEMAAGKLRVELPNYEKDWDSLLEKLHTTMSNALSRMGVKQENNNRLDRHKYMRDNFALFLRWLVRDKELSDYNPATRKLSQKQRRSPYLVEARLGCELARLGRTEAENVLSQFRTFVEKQVSRYMTIWEEENLAPDMAPIPTHARFFVAAMVLFRNRNVEAGSVDLYIRQCIRRTGGFGTERDEHGAKVGVPMSLNNLRRLPKLAVQFGVANLVGLDVAAGKIRTR